MNRQNTLLAGLFLTIAITFLAADSGRAQQPPLTPPTSSEKQSVPGSTTAPAQPTGPTQPKQVQGYTLTPAQTAQAIAYARARHELYFIDVAYSLLVLILLLQLRVPPVLRDLAARHSESQFTQTLIFAPLILFTIDVLGLPVALWSHRLALQYQQSIQGWGSWIVDWAKTEVITLAIAAPVIWILFFVIRKSPRMWWFYFWLAAVPLIVLGAVAQPLFFDPLFYKFTPLADSQPRLVERIETLVQRAGLEIPQNRIFMMNASSKQKQVNAYAAGLGASKRVVVWDTSLQRLPQDEILFIFGHEMGHYVLGHVYDNVLFSCGVLLAFLFVSYRSLHWMLRRWGETWGLRGPDDLALLPALLVLLTAYGFLFTPVSNAHTRRLERQADTYGLELIHGVVPNAPVVAAHAFQVLGEANLEEPNPSKAVKFWFYSHPSLDERMRFVQTYDPWSEGRIPKFVK